MITKVLVTALAATFLAGCGSLLDNMQMALCTDVDLEALPTGYEKSACKGAQGAQYRLGLAYERGEGVPVDYKRAAHWYRRAVIISSGSTPIYMAPVGNQKYGWTMMIDTGLPLQGINDARYRLGLLYLDGRGVRKSRSKAKKWFKRAAKRGHEEAAEVLEKLGREMREIGG